MTSASLVRLHPGPPAAITVADAYGVERPAIAGRPWLALCMVASIDGATALAGRSGGLGNATDRAVLSAMRAAADVVLVGAGTAAGEGYGAPRSKRLRIGVVTNSGRIDTSTELFTSGSGFVVAPHGVPVDGAVEVVRAGDGRVDLRAAVQSLGQVAEEVGFVSAEGGPRLNGALLDADLVDEVAVTTSPHLAGGPSSRLTAAGSEHERRFDLAHLLLDAEQFVFARWVRAVG